MQNLQVTANTFPYMISKSKTNFIMLKVNSDDV